MNISIKTFTSDLPLAALSRVFTWCQNKLKNPRSSALDVDKLTIESETIIINTLLNTMAELDERFESFRPDSLTTCAQEWEDYKRSFLIHLDAKGLYAAPGRRQVGQLLKYMGKTHIATYDTFTWRDAEPAIPGDPDNGIEARDEIPGEDRYNLNDVFAKFDQHFGVHRYRSIKRQEFLKTERKSSQSMMSFIAELKRKAEY